MDSQKVLRGLQIIFGEKTIQPFIIKKWKSILEGRVKIGNGTILGEVNLIARLPFRCTLSIGEASNIACILTMEKEDVKIRIGSRTHVGRGTLLDAACSIDIGDDVLIGPRVYIADHDSHSLYFKNRKSDVEDWIQGKKDWTHVERGPIHVSDKVWIGTRSIVLKNVTIGEGAVVGAGSVVTKDVPPYHVVAGNPAAIIRKLTEKEVSWQEK